MFAAGYCQVHVLFIKPFNFGPNSFIVSVRLFIIADFTEFLRIAFLNHALVSSNDPRA